MSLNFRCKMHGVKIIISFPHLMYVKVKISIIFVFQSIFLLSHKRYTITMKNYYIIIVTGVEYVR